MIAKEKKTNNNKKMEKVAMHALLQSYLVFLVETKVVMTLACVHQNMMHRRAACMRKIKSCISCISSFKVLLVPTIELCASRLTEKVCTYVSLRVVTSGRTRISTTTTTISDESRKQSNCLYCKHSAELIEFNVRKTYDVKQNTYRRCGAP